MTHLHVTKTRQCALFVPEKALTQCCFEVGTPVPTLKQQCINASWLPGGQCTARHCFNAGPAYLAMRHRTASIGASRSFGCTVFSWMMDERNWPASTAQCAWCPDPPPPPSALLPTPSQGRVIRCSSTAVTSRQKDTPLALLLEAGVKANVKSHYL